MTSPATARECRFAIHMPSRAPDQPDLHLIKEILHHEDGTTEPFVRFTKDFQRPFWVARPSTRNYEQKKEYASLDDVIQYQCTQSNMARAVANAMGQGYRSKPQLRQLSESPYLYGTDITSTAIIKYSYKKQYPDAISPYSTCFFDIETDVLHGTDDPIIITTVYKGTLKTWVLESTIKGYADPDGLYDRTLRKYLGPVIDKYQFKVEFVVMPDTVTMIQEAFKQIHAWSPDFLAIWNMDFDIPRIMDTLKKYDVDPKTVFSDPRIPPDRQFCVYKKGSTKKITASGAVKPKNPSEQWHSVYCPAGFYIIDAMCSYRFVRQGEQEQQSYSLDAILAREELAGKLKFAEADGLVELDWHVFMQQRHPFEYLCYAAQDVIGMFELEAKTNDLSQSLPVQCGITDFSKYNHQTKRFADDIHFFLLERGKVVGSVPPKPKDAAEDADLDLDAEDDEEVINADDDDPTLALTTRTDVLGLKNWICTLKAHMSMLGMLCIQESGTVPTLIRAFVYDSDAVSAYPTCTAVGNVSKETTKREIIDIIGIDEADFRRHNINLLQGHVNALEYACEMYKLPKPQDCLVYFDDLAA